MTVRRAGDTALLVETGEPAAAHRLHAALAVARETGAAPFAGVIDVVPGERTVLITTDPRRCDLGRLAAGLAGLPLPERDEAGGPPVEIPVVYDGADLDEVATMTGLSPTEVINRHLGSDHVVAYLGFAPGFGYLTGLDPALHVPRRDVPRTAVPAGAVAIAGPYASVYPSRSPGGWRLLGHTELALWDAGGDPPALLRPGRRVRFVARRARAPLSPTGT